MIMSVIQFWMILSLVAHFICGAPDGISKRAQSQSLPRASSNFSNVQRHADNTSAKPVVIETAVSAVGVKEEICPSHLVPHNVGDATICCVPVFNCPVDHGIISCEKDGETDQCRQCPPGMVQKNNVSSLNMEEAHCYSEINTRNCMLDDTKPSRKISEVTSCPLRCECKNEECWYGKDPCACNLSNTCPINCTMNRETGECEKCPWYSLKDYVGCGTCTVIPEKWRVRNEHPATPVDSCTIKKTTVEESTEVTILEPTVVHNNVLAICLAVVIVLFVVLIAGVFIYLRKRCKNADRNRHNEHDDLELRDNPIVVELQDGYKTVGERQKIVPKAHNRDGDSEHIPFEELEAVVGGEAPVDNNLMDKDDGFENEQNIQDENDASHENIPLLEQNVLNAAFCPTDRKSMMKKEEQPDDHRNGNSKIRRFGCSSNSGKPTAVIGPVRLNSVPQHSVQESSERMSPARIQNLVLAVSLGSQDYQRARLRLYMASFGSDAYALLHANDRPDDISNFEELNPETISSNNESLSESPENEEGNLSTPREQSRGSEKSSIPQALNGDHYVQRSDLQRTFSKNEKEDNNVADTVARSRNEETFLKTPVQDPTSDTTSDKNFVCKTENSESESDIDDIDAEKRKNSEAVKDADPCSEKVKEVDGDAQDTNKKGHKVEKSDTLVQTASSENDLPVETVAETDSAELSSDCLTTAADSSSVEMYLVNSLGALDGSVSIKDKTGDTVSGNDKNGDSES